MKIFNIIASITLLILTFLLFILDKVTYIDNIVLLVLYVILALFVVIELILSILGISKKTNVSKLDNTSFEMHESIILNYENDTIKKHTRMAVISLVINILNSIIIGIMIILMLVTIYQRYNYFYSISDYDETIEDCFRDICLDENNDTVSTLGVDIVLLESEVQENQSMFKFEVTNKTSNDLTIDLSHASIVFNQIDAERKCDSKSQITCEINDQNIDGFIVGPNSTETIKIDLSNYEVDYEKGIEEETFEFKIYYYENDEKVVSDDDEFFSVVVYY